MRTPVKVILIVLSLVSIAAIVGSIYNRVAIRRYQELARVPGQFLVVDGYKMHLYCIGTGEPSVVIEGGLGDTWIGWQLVQPELARLTRVCSYDRLGLGWSDPSTGPRDAQTIVDQLHQSLTQAGVSGRLVLIGQSAGGLFVRVYATKYFSTIAGLVLVDATPPESFDRIPDNHETPGQRAARHREAWYSKIKDMVGVSRLTGRCQPPLPSALRSYERYALAEACRPEYETSWLGEMDSFEVSASEARNTSFGNLPLLVISQDPDRPKPGWPARDINANPIWAAMQEQLKTLSTRSRRVIARRSGHRVQFDRPDAIVREVSELVLEIRGTAPSPARYGTTITE